jgi:hypothetical protein
MQFPSRGMPHTYETAALGLAESAVGEAGIAQTKDQHGGSVDMEIQLEGDDRSWLRASYRGSVGVLIARAATCHPNMQVGRVDYCRCGSSARCLVKRVAFHHHSAILSTRQPSTMMPSDACSLSILVRENAAACQIIDLPSREHSHA